MQYAGNAPGFWAGNFDDGLVRLDFGKSLACSNGISLDLLPAGNGAIARIGHDGWHDHKLRHDVAPAG